MRFSRDGTLIATGGADGKVRVWLSPSLKLKHTLDAFNEDVDDVCFNAERSQLVATASVPHALIYSSAGGELLHTIVWYAQS